MPCARCHYWDHTTVQSETPDHRTNPLGRCRRHAPALPRNGTRGEWPVTESTGWCGEFGQRGDDVL